jgi:hypothetical protein
MINTTRGNSNYCFPVFEIKEVYFLISNAGKEQENEK